MLWCEIYLGSAAAAEYCKQIRTRDYFTSGIRGSDLEDFVGDYPTIVLRLNKVRGGKFAVNMATLCRRQLMNALACVLKTMNVDGIRSIVGVVLKHEEWSIFACYDTCRTYMCIYIYICNMFPHGGGLVPILV